MRSVSKLKLFAKRRKSLLQRRSHAERQRAAYERWWRIADRLADRHFVIPELPEAAAPHAHVAAGAPRAVGSVEARSTDFTHANQEHSRLALIEEQQHEEPPPHGAPQPAEQVHVVASSETQPVAEPGGPQRVSPSSSSSLAGKDQKEKEDVVAMALPNHVPSRTAPYSVEVESSSRAVESSGTPGTDDKEGETPGQDEDGWDELDDFVSLSSAMGSIDSRVLEEHMEEWMLRKRWLAHIRDPLWVAFDDPTSSRLAQVLGVFIMSLIVISAVGICVETLPNIGDEFSDRWFYVEACVVAVFTLEYLLRLFSTPDVRRFLFDGMNTIDLIAIVPFYVELLSSSSNVARGSAVFRAVRLVRVFRIFKISRYLSWGKMWAEVVRQSSQPLSMLLFIMLLALVVFSTAIYFVERGEYNDVLGMYEITIDGIASRSQFQSIPEAFYWCMVTLTTVGYGDVVPRTGAGQFLASITCVFGILVLAVPISVISQNFTTLYSRAKHLRQLAPAFIPVEPEEPDVPPKGKDRARALGMWMSFMHTPTVRADARRQSVEQKVRGGDLAAPRAPAARRRSANFLAAPTGAESTHTGSTARTASGRTMTIDEEEAFLDLSAPPSRKSSLWRRYITVPPSVSEEMQRVSQKHKRRPIYRTKSMVQMFSTRDELRQRLSIMIDSTCKRYIRNVDRVLSSQSKRLKETCWELALQTLDGEIEPTSRGWGHE